MSARYPSASLFIGGYEHEERQPHPLVAMDFANEAEAWEASQWLSGEERLILQMRSTPEGDLRVSIATGSEIVCEGEVWRDEMWRIFMEYLRQGEAVLFAVSVGGTVRPETLSPLPGEAVQISEEARN
ncbi:hypothetical protein GCM10007416_08950 [Kroppenstedtia guangzhouensis]|uniref:Uncharacterized protein n=1 Tax=Kroppenstedtia guangzhouensis TaxID=1274356 RepID=A0ABQ1G7F8_9BACL|nr:hypothetical protein [Kroppenstedtia guangzhouensis]GGA38193.1 hypothetical protein GCM10007416_08950 [Kroppenstedtia guangzhouensis]